MSSELRKSLESIQSLLSQNPSPMTGTSLASRIHRASLESGLESCHSDLGRSPPPPTNRQSHHEGMARRGGSLNEEQQRSSGVSFQDWQPSPLAPIAEPGSHGSHHSSLHSHGHDYGAQQQAVSSTQSPQSQSRDSLSYTPFNQIESQTQQQSHHDSQLQPQRRSMTPFQNLADATSPVAPLQYIDSHNSAANDAASPFQYIDSHDSATNAAAADSMGIVGSPSSAFSAVGKKKLSAGSIAIGMSGPPFGGGDRGMYPVPTGGATPSGHSVMSGALGSISSASRIGGQSTAASSHFGDFDASAGKRTTLMVQHHYDGGMDTMSAGKYHDYSRRETSLLVSPVSHHSSLHCASPQSEISAIDGTPPGALDLFASQQVSPLGTANTTLAAASASHGPTGTPLVAASAKSPSAAHGVFASQHASPPGVAANTTLAGASVKNATHHGPTGTPFAASSHGPTGTPFVASSHGPTGTPFAASSSANAIGSSGSSKNRTPATAGLTIHTNLQPANGRDPTPYRNHSNPSTTSPYSSKGSYSNDKKASDTRSSRSGRDPPAKSPFPTSISASGTSFLVTSKSTPNVHYHKDQQAEENELSMIEEDASLSAEDNQSVVSNVTGPTFVRTPIGRKLHGHHHTPRNNTNTASGGSHSTTGNSHGHRSLHSHIRAHHTPRSTTATQHFHHTTPGSITNTVIHATPSKMELLHRPSLAMRESLAQIATTTTHALEEIWDCVGVAPDERASQLADLLETFAQLCEAKVQDEEGVRVQFRKEISEARKEWEDVCNSLQLEREEDPVSKMRRDPSSKDLGSGSGVSLQWEYEAMMGRLESLRSVKQAAMADMQTSQGRIYEAFAALQGCSIEEASQAIGMQPYLDIETNLTLVQRESFRSKAEEYEESVAARTKAIVTLLLDCQSAIGELEIVPPSDVCVGRCEDDAKIMGSLEPIEETVDNYGHRRGQSNQYTIVSLFESPTCIGIGKSALDRLTDRIVELNGEKRRRRAMLGEMGSAIGALWSMLRVPQEEQKAFTTSVRGLGLDTLRKGEAEIVRLDELKGVMIGKLVREQRQMIEELWDKTNSSVAERASFDNYFHIHEDEQLTSEVLVKHEEYVATLKSKLEKMQPILDFIAKREAIIEERIDLELLEKDPDRLKGRGATNQLMKEEKIRRRVKKELPRITSILERKLWQWYEENKPPTGTNNEEGENDLDPNLGHFMYQGSPYLQAIQSQEEEWQTRKERGEQERQRKRREEQVASSSANAAFGYTTIYTKLPGKKWNPPTNTNANHNNNAAASTRPRSASSLRSGSNMRSGGSHPTTGISNPARSGSNMRFGSRGPLGDVSSSRQNTSRPPSRPRGGPVGGGAAGGGGMDRGKKTAATGGRGYRPASAPRMRL